METLVGSKEDGFTPVHLSEEGVACGISATRRSGLHVWLTVKAIGEFRDENDNLIDTNFYRLPAWWDLTY